MTLEVLTAWCRLPAFQEEGRPGSGRRQTFPGQDRGAYQRGEGSTLTKVVGRHGSGFRLSVFGFRVALVCCLWSGGRPAGGRRRWSSESKAWRAREQDCEQEHPGTTCLAVRDMAVASAEWLGLRVALLTRISHQPGRCRQSDEGWRAERRPSGLPPSSRDTGSPRHASG